MACIAFEEVFNKSAGRIPRHYIYRLATNQKFLRLDVSVLVASPSEAAQHMPSMRSCAGDTRENDPAYPSKALDKAQIRSLEPEIAADCAAAGGRLFEQEGGYA